MRMFGNAPFRWTDPSTWPFIFFVWLLFMLAGFATPVWRWWRRQVARSWPTALGKIESVNVMEPQKSFFTPSSRFGRAPAFRAELAYSYTVAEKSYRGRWHKDFGSWEEGREFVRDLEGKPVSVAYSPLKPARSLLLDDAVAMLHSTRPPAPAGVEVGPPVKDIPSWARPLLWPLIVLSAAGLGTSLWVHLAAIAGQKVAPEPLFWILHAGIFVVFLPAVLVARGRLGITHHKDFWKLVLRGAPAWMKYTVYGLLGYAVVSSLLFMNQTSEPLFAATTVGQWRVFSSGWMAFYSASLAILYAAVHRPEESATQLQQGVDR
jgi:hypothetical protein